MWRVLVGPDTRPKRLAATRGYAQQHVGIACGRFHIERSAPALEAVARSGRHNYGAGLCQFQGKSLKRFIIFANKDIECRCESMKGQDASKFAKNKVLVDDNLQFSLQKSRQFCLGLFPQGAPPSRLSVKCLFAVALA